MTLREFFEENPVCAVAFSGGVDSAVLLSAAAAYGRKAAAYFVRTVFQPVFELEDARETAGRLGVELRVPEAFHLYTMAAMPENASLEQRNLGFPHCTPVLGHLTSTFGWREHPVEGGSKFHYGVDLAANTGTDVLAFAAGEVYASGESSTLGNYIMLQHEGGYITLYAHCSRITASSGSVAMGEKIAEVGDTGLVTGPHLHFELHDGALYLNPIYYVEVG